VVRRPRAVALALAAVAIPAPSVAGIEDRSAWAAVPKLVLKRVGWLVYQAARWVTGRGRPRSAAAGPTDDVAPQLSPPRALT
jgi:hypothetical protein